MTTVQDVINWAAGSTRAAGLCQGFAGNDFTGHFGSFKVGYASANAALAASKAAGTFHAAPPPAGRITWVFYAFPTYGHVMLSLGDGRALGDTSQATTKLNASRTVGLMPWNAYSYTYLGYADTNGANTIPTIPTPAPVDPRIRTTVAAGANVHSTPDADVTSRIGLPFKGNYEVTCTSYTTGATANGTNIWFYATAPNGSGYISASSVTNPSTDGIPLDQYVAPVVTPPAPVVHTVTFDVAGGTPAAAVQVITDGSDVTKPADPTLAGSTFDFWTADGTTAYDFTSAVKSDLTLTANYTVIPVVTPPADPTTPTDPTTPVTPTDPTTPIEPSKPTTPTKPVTPAKQSIISIILNALANFFKSFKFGNPN